MDNTDRKADPELPFSISYEKELPNVVKEKEIRKENGAIILTAKYLPSLAHSERFCDMTGDDNPIHREHPEYHEAISPAFLQNSITSLLFREAMTYRGIDVLDYPFSTASSVMDGGILTSLEYDVEVKVEPGRFPAAYAQFISPKGGKVHKTHKMFYNKQPDAFFHRIDPSRQLHTSEFTGKNISEFGKLIGAESPESNLFAVSASSSIVFDALEKGKLGLDDDVCVFYREQKIVSDASHSLDLRKGISLELYLSDAGKFGKTLAQNETLEMQIVARDPKGRVIYSISAPLSFPRRGMFEMQFKKYFRSRKRT